MSACKPHIVLLSGTHVTGKETLALTLSDSLGCPWLKGEMAHAMASFGARSQATRGFDYGEVFARIWSSKIHRIGFPPDKKGHQPDEPEPRPRLAEGDCVAVITCYAMRKPARDAMRAVVMSHSLRPVFVILQITKETLSGRTLGAEDPELAERIMGEKAADIEEPLGEERDVILTDSMHDVDTLLSDIQDRIAMLLAKTD